MKKCKEVMANTKAHGKVTFRKLHVMLTSSAGFRLKREKNWQRNMKCSIG